MTSQSVLKKIILLLIAVFIAFSTLLFPETVYLNAVIDTIISKEVYSPEMQIDTGLQCRYELKAVIAETGKTVIVDYAVETRFQNYDVHPSPGDRIILRKDTDQGAIEYNFEDYDRLSALKILIFLFIATVLVFTGKKGFNALFALFITLVLVFYLFIPMVSGGYPPILCAVLICGLSTVITLVIIGGLTVKTCAAVTGTLGGVATAGVIALIIGHISRITGNYSQELSFLNSLRPALDIRDLITSGFIIGALGATMDVAMSISSSMIEIFNANRLTSFRTLFKSGLSIGRDIIGTMINTLILAYTGSSLSILLLFFIQKKEFPLSRIVNFEMIFIEVFKSVSGSIGMLAAIPLTALTAALLLSTKRSVKAIDR